MSRQCTSGTECLSHTLGSHSECAVRTPSGVNRKILSIRKEPMLSSLLTLNAQSILLHAGKKSSYTQCTRCTESPCFCQSQTHLKHRLSHLIIISGGKVIWSSSSYSTRYHYMDEIRALEAKAKLLCTWMWYSTDCTCVFASHTIDVGLFVGCS